MPVSWCIYVHRANRQRSALRTRDAKCWRPAAKGLLDRLASRHGDLTAGTRSLRNLRSFAAKKVFGNLSEKLQTVGISTTTARLTYEINGGHRRPNYWCASGAAHAKLAGSFRLPWPE